MIVKEGKRLLGLIRGSYSGKMLLYAPCATSFNQGTQIGLWVGTKDNKPVIVSPSCVNNRQGLLQLGRIIGTHQGKMVLVRSTCCGPGGCCLYDDNWETPIPLPSTLYANLLHCIAITDGDPIFEDLYNVSVTLERQPPNTLGGEVYWGSVVLFHGNPYLSFPTPDWVLACVFTRIPPGPNVGGPFPGVCTFGHVCFPHQGSLSYDEFLTNSFLSSQLIFTTSFVDVESCSPFAARLLNAITPDFITGFHGCCETGYDSGDLNHFGDLTA